jgi:WD40 repeat protein
LLREIAVHSTSIEGLAVTADGRFCISGSFDRHLCITDLDSGKVVAKTLADSHCVNYLALSDDGKTLVSGGGHFFEAGKHQQDGDYSLRIWKLPELIWIKATAAALQPFVVLAKAKRAETRHPTLAAAVADAQSGDTIEVRGNGPFLTARVEVDRPLTIRAGSGFVPKIVMDPAHSETEVIMIHVQAALVMEGIDVAWDRKNPAKVDAGRSPALFNTSNLKGKLWLSNCRIAASKHCFVAPPYFARYGFGNCYFVTPGTFMSGSNWFDGEGSIENSIVHAVGGVHFQETGVKTTKAGSITLRRCTLPIGRQFSFGLLKLPDAKGLPQHTVNIEDCLLVKVDSITSGFGTREPVTPTQLMEIWRDRVRFTARNNFLEIAPNGDAFGFRVGVQKREGPTNLIEWQKFWGLPADSFREGTANFAALLTVDQHRIGEFTPADFRLAKGSPGQGVLPGGKDLGADVDLVGPGEAYERWQKTPEYQEWRKKTEELMRGK